jgi:hypothetical protein
MEESALGAFDGWVSQVGPKANLLRRGLEVLNEHQVQRPPFSDNFKAQYLFLLKNSRASALPNPPDARNKKDWLERTESAILEWSGTVPREEVRAPPLVRAVVRDELRKAAMPYWELAALRKKEKAHQSGEPMNSSNARTWSGRALDSLELVASRPEVLDLCDLRATRLQVALALYEVENRKPARRLSQLVPRYLKELPIDPYSGQSFHYRVSKGEDLKWLWLGEGGEDDLPVYRVVHRDGQFLWFLVAQRGQGIIWSTGPDMRDDGATKQVPSGVLFPWFVTEDTWGPENADLIYLVPQWKNK